MKLLLTVGPSHDVLQESVLRGHQSPPGPRHAAVSAQSAGEASVRSRLLLLLLLLFILSPSVCVCVSVRGRKCGCGGAGAHRLPALLLSSQQLSPPPPIGDAVGASLHAPPHQHHPAEENRGWTQQ